LGIFLSAIPMAGRVDPVAHGALLEDTPTVRGTETNLAKPSGVGGGAENEEYASRGAQGESEYSVFSLGLPHHVLGTDRLCASRPLQKGGPSHGCFLGLTLLQETLLHPAAFCRSDH